MRKSSKVLAILFLMVAGGLVFWSTQKGEAEIQAAVEARLEPTRAEQERALEAAYAERQRALEEEYAEREQALADTLAAREQAVRDRLAALDSARAGVDTPVYYRLDADAVEPVLRRMGLDYERGVDNEGIPKFDFRLATYNVVLYFYTCEDEECASLRLYAGFDTTPTPETILEWGRTKRFATAYLNEDGKARLDSDLIVTGGITLGAVEAFILNFRDRLTEFAVHLGS